MRTSDGPRAGASHRRRPTFRAALVLAACTALAACGSSGGSSSSAPAVTSTSTGIESSPSVDTHFYLDLATADPALATYVDGRSDVALHALLAEGVDFCDVLDRGGGIDDAMTSVAAGADRVEDQTGLPRSIRTFNSIDSAALLTLCPADQRRLPPAAQSNLRQLARALAASQT